jgi:hypothetical protein
MDSFFKPVLTSSTAPNAGAKRKLEPVKGVKGKGGVPAVLKKAKK